MSSSSSSRFGFPPARPFPAPIGHAFGPSPSSLNELLYIGRSELHRTQVLKSVLNTVSNQRIRSTPSQNRESFPVIPDDFSGSDSGEEEDGESSAPINFLESFWMGSDCYDDDSSQSIGHNPLDEALQTHTDSSGMKIDDALDFITGLAGESSGEASSVSSGEEQSENGRQWSGRILRFRPE
jgi:hypothetical protein